MFYVLSLCLVLVRMIAIQPNSLTPPRFSGHTNGAQTVGIGATDEVRKAGEVVDILMSPARLHECCQVEAAECAPPMVSLLFVQLVMLVLGKDGSLNLCTQGQYDLLN